MSLLAEAIALAARYHVNQVDKSGDPYILHPIRVMQHVRLSGYREEVQAAAVLHDILEDTDIDPQDLEDFDPEVNRLVRLVSRREWEEDRGDGILISKKEIYADFIRRASSDRESWIIKNYDILDNLSRLDKLTPENQKFLSGRYARALEIMNQYI